MVRSRATRASARASRPRFVRSRPRRARRSLRSFQSCRVRRMNSRYAAALAVQVRRPARAARAARCSGLRELRRFVERLGDAGLVGEFDELRLVLEQRATGESCATIGRPRRAPEGRRITERPFLREVEEDVCAATSDPHLSSPAGESAVAPRKQLRGAASSVSGAQRSVACQTRKIARRSFATARTPDATFFVAIVAPAPSTRRCVPRGSRSASRWLGPDEAPQIDAPLPTSAHGQRADCAPRAPGLRRPGRRTRRTGTRLRRVAAG